MNTESGNILIVDDERSIRLSLRTILGNFGFDIVEAARGEEALSLVRTEQFDAVLLDINMPGRSGFEVLKDVKHTYAHLPVIMVSVQAESQYALRCLRAGAAEYVNKNCASEELVPAIKKIMESGARLARNPIAN